MGRFLERLYEKIGPADPVTGCRLWLGGCSAEGYGRLWVGQGARSTAAPAHVIVWEIETGQPWPPGKHADHRPTCDHACVEPSHITPVEPEENYGWRKYGARGASR